MNKRLLLHVLLIAALCFSQFAAAVHMVGHFHADFANVSASCNFADIHAHRDSCTNTSHQTQNHSGPHLHAATVQTTDAHAFASQHPDNSEADCAIYHAYLGQSVCLTAANTEVTNTATAIADTPKVTQHIATPVRDHRHIRGPPPVS